MKFFSLISLLFILVSVVFADSDDVVLVEYFACFPFSEDFENTIADFLEEIEHYLADTEIVVNFETVSVLTCGTKIPFADASLLFYEDIEDSTVIDQKIHIALSPYNLRHISLILQNEKTFSISIAEDYAPMLVATAFLYQANQTDIALANFIDLKNIIDDVRTLNDINYYLGNIALLDGNISWALDYYEISSLGYSTNLAWVLVQLNETDKAIDHLTEMVDYSEGLSAYPVWLRNRAHIYALAFDYTSAIGDMNTAINYVESEVFDADLYLEAYIEPHGIAGLLSTLYKERGDMIMLIYEWNRALEDYNTALELDPDYAEAYYRRGILLYTMVEREDAITDFERYLELNPEGQFAESATDYIASIQVELDALGG